MDNWAAKKSFRLIGQCNPIKTCRALGLLSKHQFVPGDTRWRNARPSLQPVGATTGRPPAVRDRRALSGENSWPPCLPWDVQPVFCLDCPRLRFGCLAPQLLLFPYFLPSPEQGDRGTNEELATEQSRIGLI
jgi:hypothetical protein